MLALQNITVFLQGDVSAPEFCIPTRGTRESGAVGFHVLAAE